MDDKKQKRKNLILELFKDSLYVPMRRKELAIFMQVSDADRDSFDEILDELISEGKIEISKRGKLVLSSGKPAPKQDKSLEGIYIGNQRGFGFVSVEGSDEDYFIPEGMSLNAFHGDKVEIVVSSGYVSKDKRKEAKVVRIVERNTDNFVGTYEASKNFGFVICDNTKIDRDIFIPAEKSKGAVTGSKVLVNITDYGDARRNPEGEVVRVIGHADDPGVDILSISLAFGIPDTFPEKVLNQAERANKPISDKDCEGRVDLRDTLMVTIDGEDSKDLDDAVSLDTEGDLYVLGVHIADVSNYVQENSAIDREALKRGTSVYLADRVIPML
ncbi:MAG: RNB domain-containing ribonuclease, partial [Lachnospiraceae bacterium]|nr:RNB domain-containing ribonuclease [Lachnospiraceae bacterium]